MTATEPLTPVMFTVRRSAVGWAVLVDREVIGQVILLTRGQGWRAGLNGEWATGRHPTRLGAAAALVTRHRELAS